MSVADRTTGPGRDWRMEITGGGVPTAEHLAALSAVATAVVESHRPTPADLRPAPYRSRWRRAAMLELREVPVGIKDNGAPWGGLA